MSRSYPDDSVGPFERPPETFTDAHAREIEISVYDDEEFAALAEMYVAFDPADRAQGIPPANEGAIDEWLDTILASGYDVVAYHGDACVGHATLVADSDGAHELAIFVLDTHQAAGIGSRLLEALLGHAGREGTERVWLTVERWNQTAIALYRKVGFGTCDTESFEMEMAIRL
jgi:ribosomal protein S18 acetylase RimI-like enzyme